jgi:UDP-N-acetylglucosamine pyrophosphorylase
VTLREELQCVLPEFQERVHRTGALTDNELVSLTTRQDADPAMYHPDQPNPRHVVQWDEVSEHDDAVGDQMIKDGKVAFVVMSGGAGTRLGRPKAFATIPGIETSLLAWKVMQGAGMPTWIMTSARGMDHVVQHVKHLVLPPRTSYHVFEQFEGYRLTPDNRLSWMFADIPDLYPLGHGDVGPALVESGVLADNPNVKYVYVCNVDNVLAAPHSGLLGLHARVGTHVTCEVVDRIPADKGGVLAIVNNRTQIAEDWRLPEGFVEHARWHNTNTMIINVNVLKADVQWRWHRVRKQVDDRIVIQHERLLQQYTEEFPTQFVHVPREARYQGVKTEEDLEEAGRVLMSYQYS